MKWKDHISAIVAMNTITKLLETHSPDDPEVVSTLLSNRNLIYQAQRHAQPRPFIALPQQLDITQPEDFGYGTEEWRARWSALPKRLRYKKAEAGFTLSWSRNLHPRVLAKSVLHSRNNPFGLLHEVSISGGRRCCFVRGNGMRCMSYGPAPVCNYHYRLVESVPRMNDRFLSVIKSEPLRVAYEKHLTDPNRKGIESEIALMRTMLDSLINRIEVGADLNKLPLELMSQITIMCKTISETVERMANMEAKLGMRMTLDQVTAIVMGVVDLVIKTCPTLEQAQLTALADGIESLSIGHKVPTAESLDASTEYGMNTTQGKKNTTARDKLSENGEVVHEAFTEEEVTAHSEFVNNKFKPAQKKYFEDKAKTEALLKAAEVWGVPTDDLITPTTPPTKEPK